MTNSSHVLGASSNLLPMISVLYNMEVSNAIATLKYFRQLPAPNEEGFTDSCLPPPPPASSAAAVATVTAAAADASVPIEDVD